MSKPITDLHAAQRIDDRMPTVWPLYCQRPHCTGACDQGRKPCQAPEACLHPVDDPDAINAADATLICLGYLLTHPITWLAGGVLFLAALAHLAARMGWL